MPPIGAAASLVGMDGLYALKPWYGNRLAGIRRMLVAGRISPNAITWTGAGFGAAAGVVLATLRPGPIAGITVAAMLAARLACANLDGSVAREAGRTSRFGPVVNELGDRIADLLALCGLLAVADPAIVAAAALATTLPSWVSMSGAAAGAPRINGGPMGKTERCLVLVAIAATGATAPLLALMSAGAIVTAVVRGATIRRALA